MKTEVYSWRVSSELKSQLERVAHTRKTSVSKILDEAARSWLKNGHSVETDEEEQRRLHALADKHIGVIAGGDPTRSQRVRELVRERLARKYGR